VCSDRSRTETPDGRSAVGVLVLLSKSVTGEGSPVPSLRPERTEYRRTAAPTTESPNRGTTQHHAKTQTVAAREGVTPEAEGEVRGEMKIPPAAAPHDAQNIAACR
jgi:hypothetical protein